MFASCAERGRRRARAAAAALALAGVALVGQALGSQAREAWVQLRLARALGRQATVRVAGTAMRPAARIALPGCGLDAVALASTSRTPDDELALAPVAWRERAEGPLLVAGHRDGRFAALFDARVGDRATLHDGGTTRELVVASRAVVSPEDRRVLEALTSDDVVLVTCWPRRVTGPAPRRLLVVLRPLACGADGGGAVVG